MRINVDYVDYNVNARDYMHVESVLKRDVERSTLSTRGYDLQSFWNIVHFLREGISRNLI